MPTEQLLFLLGLGSTRCLICSGLGAELKAQFRGGRGSEALTTAVESGLPEESDVREGQGTSWLGFVKFVRDYMIFWRDGNFCRMFVYSLLVYKYMYFIML